MPVRDSDARQCFMSSAGTDKPQRPPPGADLAPWQRVAGSSSHAAPCDRGKAAQGALARRTGRPQSGGGQGWRRQKTSTSRLPETTGDGQNRRLPASRPRSEAAARRRWRQRQGIVRPRRPGRGRAWPGALSAADSPRLPATRGPRLAPRSPAQVPVRCSAITVLLPGNCQGPVDAPRAWGFVWGLIG